MLSHFWVKQLMKTCISNIVTSFFEWISNEYVGLVSDIKVKKVKHTAQLLKENLHAC